MLRAINIHKIYNNGVSSLHVLKGIDINVDRGDFAVITGPSGAGKSTLLHILGSLDFPTQGNVFFEGKDIVEADEPALFRIRNERIGFVFQFYHLLSEFTVLENVMMPAIINRKSKIENRKIKEEAVWFLEKLEIKNRSGHFPNQLSGGEKQRVAIARSLINRPQILFCDEPTGNLDSETGQQIMSLIKKINMENKMTVVLATHNLELTGMADKEYHLKDGMLMG